MNNYSHLKEGDEHKIVFANRTFIIVTRCINGKFTDISVDLGTSRPTEEFVIKKLKEIRERYKCNQ